MAAPLLTCVRAVVPPDGILDDEAATSRVCSSCDIEEALDEQRVRRDQRSFVRRQVRHTLGVFVAAQLPRSGLREAHRLGRAEPMAGEALRLHCLAHACDGEGAAWGAA